MRENQATKLEFDIEEPIPIISFIFLDVLYWRVICFLTLFDP